MPVMQHPVLGEVQYTMTVVPSGGDDQTADVIDLMRQYVTEDARDPKILSVAQAALAQYDGDGGGGSSDPAAAIFWWVKGNLRFVQDAETASPVPTNSPYPVVEALIRPVDMVALPSSARQGDCDDFSMMTAALLTALGIEAKFVTVAADGGSQDYSHVYVAAYVGGRRIPLDTSHGQYPGWETAQGSRRREWAVVTTPGMIAAVAATLGIGVYLICR